MPELLNDAVYIFYPIIQRNTELAAYFGRNIRPLFRAGLEAMVLLIKRNR